jgi:hypothetical protein
MLLHVGGASATSVLIAVFVIFLLIFSMSFAFGPIPEGKRRFSGEWMAAWLRASLPRLLVAGVFSGLLFTGSALSGNGQDATATSCDQPLPPVTGNAVTDARVLQAIDGMEQIAGAARADDRDRVRTLFFTGDAHNLTHDLDPVLRPLAPETGRALCERVIALEEQMAGEFETQTVAQLAGQIAARLQEARPFLQQTSGTPVVAAGPCASPLAAATSEPLTEARIRAAIAQFELLAEAAPESDLEGAAQLFFGAAHNITHDIDPPLRAENPELAIELCNAVLTIEQALASAYDGDAVARQATASARLLEEAGKELRILE